MTETGWEEVTAVHPIHLQPCYLSTKERLEEGVHRYLCTYLYKYDPLLKCIPVAFSRVDWSMAAGVGRLTGDSPRVHFDVRVRWTAFVPRPGLEVGGTVVHLDVTGMVVSLVNDDEAHLKALVMAADLRDEWTWRDIDHGHYCDAMWEALPAAHHQVPAVGQKISVVVSGTGGPTGILARLQRQQRVVDGFQQSPM